MLCIRNSFSRVRPFGKRFRIFVLGWKGWDCSFLSTFFSSSALASGLAWAPACAVGDASAVLPRAASFSESFRRLFQPHREAPRNEYRLLPLRCLFPCCLLEVQSHFRRESPRCHVMRTAEG